MREMSTERADQTESRLDGTRGYFQAEIDLVSAAFDRD